MSLTPLVTLDNVKNNIDFKGDIIVKDESYLPTASLRQRFMFSSFYGETTVITYGYTS